MKTKEEKIRKISKAVYACMVILAIFVLLSAIVTISAYAQGNIDFSLYKIYGADSQSPNYNKAMLVMRTMLLSLLAAECIFIALIFREIGQNETPFTPKVASRIKVFAILMFCRSVLPVLVGTAMANQSIFIGIRLLFTFDMFLLIVKCVAIYCFGLVLDYGCRIQDENYEIL